eukprot:m.89928 g.89928  ORF g.89928 m.89928 type:complete len:341 (+) comp26346_c0_seq1:159-1181(+)
MPNRVNRKPMSGPKTQCNLYQCMNDHNICEWQSPQHGRCIRLLGSNGGKFCSSHTCANLRCRKGKSSRDRCCHSCSATYASALFTIDTPTIGRVPWDNKIHFGCDCTSCDDLINTNASRKSMCSWVSTRGVCQSERHGRSKYCVFHACPQPKCMKGKASTKPRCPRHCTDNDDTSRPPLAETRQRQQRQNAYTDVPCSHQIHETNFGDDQRNSYKGEDFWETLPVRSGSLKIAVGDVETDTDTDTLTEPESCVTTTCNKNTASTFPSVNSGPANHATLLQHHPHHRVTADSNPKLHFPNLLQLQTAINPVASFPLVHVEDHHIVERWSSFDSTERDVDVH